MINKDLVIFDEWVDPEGKKWSFEYHNSDDFLGLPYDRCKQCYGVCFYNEKMVIGYGGNKKSWGLIGGTIEKGETFIETLTREVEEESNMRVISAMPIGYQKVPNAYGEGDFYQLRFMAVVEPIGEFVSDPAGGITEIKLIDPKEYKSYFDWGTIGDEIIRRANELYLQSKINL